MTTEEFNLENYSDFQTLKNDVNQYHLKYVVISNALGISRKDFVYLMKFENRNLSIENIKNNTKSILGVHKAEIKQYKER